jgi:3-oxoacyl-[acyl-carrier protein] reductase
VFDVKEKVAIITGAGQGIGRAYARAFASHGAHPVLVDLRAPELEEVLAEVKEFAPHAMTAICDISDADAVQQTIAKVLSVFGRIDILINNGAIFSKIIMRPFTEIPVDEWRRVLDVNVTGTYLCCRAVAKAMQQQKSGTIINISSAAVNMGRENYLHYVTSKSAIVGLTRAMARELGRFNIRVNAISPGATDTEVTRGTITPEQKAAQISMRSLRREQTVDDLTGVALYLCSDASRFVTGQTLTVDGGLTYS